MRQIYGKSRNEKILDLAFAIGGIVILVVFTTIYQMPFRLDDVLHMDWARNHTFWDAFDVQRGEIVRSVRPVFAMTIWILTHTAGIDHYFPWHLVLVASFMIGLMYAGRTARYISGASSSLYFTTGFFWVAFLPILNVLFWYGDLTFTIELMFIAPAWYYGLKGLLEGKIGLWSAGILCGILAVLAKEPALLLVHIIFAGTIILCFADIRMAWNKKSIYQKIIAITLYIIFLAISLKLYFASPTRSNRFFDLRSLSHDQLMFFVGDRLRYYGETLLNPLARILLAAPLLYSLIRSFVKRPLTVLQFMGILLFSLFLAFVGIKSVIIFSVLLVTVPLVHLFVRRERRAQKIILLFSICAVIILAVLMITVMLVKTQLTELSFALLIITGMYWGSIVQDISHVFQSFWQLKKNRAITIALCIITIILGGYCAIPVIRAKEKLLREVRDVRNNANNAIKWMGAVLPSNSEVLVSSPGLYGLGGADEMTSKDDEYKLYAQYTFLQGYTRSYFRALDRNDIALGFLEDTAKLSGVLDSCRNLGNYFLFLQTGLDADRFHGLINGVKILTIDDSLLVRFSEGPYPSEVWKLRK